MPAPKITHQHPSTLPDAGIGYPLIIYIVLQGLLWALNALIFGSVVYGLAVTALPPTLTVLAGHLQRKREQKRLRPAIKLNYSGDSIQPSEEREEFVKLVRNL